MNEDKEKQRKPETLLGALVKRDASEVADKVIFDHVVPGLVDMVSDALHSTIDLFLSDAGSGRRRRRYSDYDRDYKYSYDEYYDRRDRRNHRRRDRDDDYIRRERERSINFSLEDIEFDSKEDAKEVLESIKDILIDFDSVSLEDVYRIPIVRDLARSKPDWTASRYGWDSVAGARIIETRGRHYILDMPPVKRI